MHLFKFASVAVVMLAGIGSVSAETVQNSRGTFIQSPSGVWHEYARVTPGRVLSNPYTELRYRYRYQDRAPELYPEVAIQ
jgi:hypothetical protein